MLQEPAPQEGDFAGNEGGFSRSSATQIYNLVRFSTIAYAGRVVIRGMSGYEISSCRVQV